MWDPAVTRGNYECFPTVCEAGWLFGFLHWFLGLVWRCLRFFCHYVGSLFFLLLPACGRRVIRRFPLCRADGRDKGVRRRPGIGLAVFVTGRLVVGSVSVAWKPAGHVGFALGGGVSRGVGSLHGNNLGGTVQDSKTLNSTERLDNSTPQARYTEC